MAADDHLFVPLEVRAFVVNDAVRTGGHFHRFQWDYDALTQFKSPEPPPFTPGESPPQNGVIVHWTLPPPLRTGRQSGASAITYPLVPNRWLVARTSGPAASRQATGWVVESDYLDATDGSSPYVDPTSGTPTRIGRVVPLEHWSESSPAQLFLRAIAPGNPMFATFEPFCDGVFAMHDPLTGVGAIDRLSYLVAGWYSQPGDDFLAAWAKDAQPDFAAFLHANGWTVDENETATATRAIYHGTVLDVAWNASGAAPPSPRPTAPVPIAVGNTAVDALTALLAAQVGPKNLAIDVDLLEAIQYGLLAAKDEPDALFELPEQVERSWFGARSGSIIWEIVGAQLAAGQSSPAPTAAERATEDAWLETLNADQRALEFAIGVLKERQQQVYELWFKDGYAQANLNAYPPSAPSSDFVRAFDDTDPTSAISLLDQQRDAVETLRQKIPNGRTQAQLETAIKAFATQNGLPAHRELRQRAVSPYTLANDPVILMAGLQMDAELVPPSPQRCRFGRELVGGITFRNAPITAADMQGTIPMPPGVDLVAPASAMRALLDELFFLDAIDAEQVASVALNTSDPSTIRALADAIAGHWARIGGQEMPALGLGGWSQPWSPLILLWSLDYVPIAHEAGGKPVWTFGGSEYDWSGDPSAIGAPVRLEGTVFLSGQACFNFRAQLQNYLNLNKDAPGAESLSNFIEATDSWHFISQSLSGMTQQLLRRTTTPRLSISADTRTFFGTKTLAELVGDQAALAPEPGPASAKRTDPTRFQAWRAGQFEIERLSVVDRFGQRLDVADASAAPVTPIGAPILKPKLPVSSVDPGRFLQLQPRLLQPARLEIDFLSAEDDEAVLGAQPGVNPVCGWLLHNYLDETVVAYDAAGSALGALWVATAAAQHDVVWRAAPSSLYETLQDIIDVPWLHHLGQFLDGIKTAGVSAFHGLELVLDDHSFTVAASDPPGERALAMLAGRPLALVRARVLYAPATPPAWDPSWPFTFFPGAPAFTSYTFPIRLGEAGRRRDSLVGYFVGEDYSKLNVPKLPAKAPSGTYLQPIDPHHSLELPFDGMSRHLLSVLTDADARIHATTGILPITSASLPEAFVNDSLRSMQITFAIGPLLTGRNLVASDSAAGAVRMPLPVEVAGAWDWLEPTPTGWQSYPVAPASTTADFDNVPPALRSGLLRLRGALDQ
jgi:hypothetical protein